MVSNLSVGPRRQHLVALGLLLRMHTLLGAAHGWACWRRA